MIFIGHILFFSFAGFTGYLLNVNRRDSFGSFLLFGLPVVGVYFLGWWAILTFIAGLIFGGVAFFQSHRVDEDN